MILVRELIEKLGAFPADALCYAYEGEICGVVVRDRETDEELGYVFAAEPGSHHVRNGRDGELIVYASETKR